LFVVVGVAFNENVDKVCGSHAFGFIHQLVGKGAQLVYADPAWQARQPTARA
jgi:UDP-N-acetyl-D-mannosaminuronate dehydrogenase